MLTKFLFDKMDKKGPTHLRTGAAPINAHQIYGPKLTSNAAIATAMGKSAVNFMNSTAPGIVSKPPLVTKKTAASTQALTSTVPATKRKGKGTDGTTTGFTSNTNNSLTTSTGVTCVRNSLQGMLGQQPTAGGGGNTNDLHGKNEQAAVGNVHTQRSKQTQIEIAARTRHAAMKGKLLTTKEKNEEAIRDLQVRIPELSKIFDINGRIGSGTFSTVLMATLKRERDLPESERRKYAIKHHNPTNHPDRIIRELECMFKMGGTQNIIGINCCIRFNDSIAFIMPYMAHDRFHDIFSSLTLPEVRDYMWNLLVALQHVHKFNVIHRDVKPSNILYNRRNRQFLLCDFGLAQRLADDGTVILKVSTDLGGDMKTNKSKEPANSELGIKPTTSIKDQENATRTRAMGGGGGGANDTVLITNSFGNDVITETGTITKPTAIPNVTFAKHDELSLAGTAVPTLSEGHVLKTFCSLSKKELAVQKAETNRLLNRLRQISPNVDINNYVVATSTGKKEMHASRAGTPGYRPPEVLLRYPFQTTAVDIWAAGVIFLSILSTMHPFFKAPNDCTALSEIMNLFGDLPIRKTAFLLDRLIMLTQKVSPLCLRRICLRLRHSEAFASPEVLRRHRHPDGSCDFCRNCEQVAYNCLCKHTNFKIESYDYLDDFPPSAYDLLNRLLEINPTKRITAEEALNHPFFDEQIKLSSREASQQSVLKEKSIDVGAMRKIKPYFNTTFQQAQGGAEAK